MSGEYQHLGILDTQPRPIKDAFRSIGTAVAFAGSVVTSLVGYGVVTAAQGDATIGLLGLIPGLVTAATSALTAYGVLGAAEPKTTPVNSPRAADGTVLVPVNVDHGTPPVDERTIKP